MTRHGHTRPPKREAAKQPLPTGTVEVGVETTRRRYGDVIGYRVADNGALHVLWDTPPGSIAPPRSVHYAPGTWTYVEWIQDDQS